MSAMLMNYRQRAALSRSNIMSSRSRWQFVRPFFRDSSSSTHRHGAGRHCAQLCRCTGACVFARAGIAHSSTGAQAPLGACTDLCAGYGIQSDISVGGLLGLGTESDVLQLPYGPMQMGGAQVEPPAFGPSAVHPEPGEDWSVLGFPVLARSELGQAVGLLRR